MSHTELTPELKARHEARVKLALAMGNAPPAPTDEPVGDFTLSELTDLLLFVLDKLSSWNGAAAYMGREEKKEALRLRMRRAIRNEGHRVTEGKESARLDELTRPSRPH